jgi:hypothetical protein
VRELEHLDRAIMERKESLQKAALSDPEDAESVYHGGK